MLKHQTKLIFIQTNYNLSKQLSFEQLWEKLLLSIPYKLYNCKVEERNEMLYSTSLIGCEELAVAI